MLGLDTALNIGFFWVISVLFKWAHTNTWLWLAIAPLVLVNTAWAVFVLLIAIGAVKITKE